MTRWFSHALCRLLALLVGMLCSHSVSLSSAHAADVRAAASPTGVTQLLAADTAPDSSLPFDLGSQGASEERESSDDDEDPDDDFDDDYEYDEDDE